MHQYPAKRHRDGAARRCTGARSSVQGVLRRTGDGRRSTLAPIRMAARLPNLHPRAMRTTRHFRKHASGPSAAYTSNAPFSLFPHSAPLAKAQLTDVCTYCQILSSLHVNRRPPDTSPRDAPHTTVWSPLPLTPVASNPKVSFSPPHPSADNSPSNPPRYPVMSVIRAAGAHLIVRPGRCSGARTALPDVQR